MSDSARPTALGWRRCLVLLHLLDRLVEDEGQQPDLSEISMVERPTFSELTGMSPGVNSDVAKKQSCGRIFKA